MLETFLLLNCNRLYQNQRVNTYWRWRVLILSTSLEILSRKQYARNTPQEVKSVSNVIICTLNILQLNLQHNLLYCYIRVLACTRVSLMYPSTLRLQDIAFLPKKQLCWLHCIIWTSITFDYHHHHHGHEDTWPPKCSYNHWCYKGHQCLMHGMCYLPLPNSNPMGTTTGII